MQKLRFSELSEAIRNFLAGAEDGMIIENDAGQPQYSIAPYHQPTMEERQRALKGLQKIQAKVQKHMQAEGKTVEQFEQLVFEDE